MDVTLKPSKAPNLPAASQDYSPLTVEQINNALRLYFNQVDNVTGTLLTATGGAYLGLPHIAASDTTNQYAAADDTRTLVAWNTLDSGNGFTLYNDGSAASSIDGVFKIDYSLQFVNTDNAAHDVTVWLRTDGADVAGSASKFTIPARKSVGVYGYLVAYSSIVFPVVAGEKIYLYWATGKAYNTTGPVDGVYMAYEPVQTSPFAHPSVPSAVGSITFVSRINP